MDSDVWPGNGGASASAIEEIARSPEWTGLVLIAPVGGFDMEIDNLANQRGLPARFVLFRGHQTSGFLSCVAHWFTFAVAC